MKANLLVLRGPTKGKTTIGRLFINNQYFCWTLEDQIRPYGVKVPGETAIPEGGPYKVALSMSYRFKRVMPMIYTEPNGYEFKAGGISFKGLRAHGGNTHLNTDGCVLVAHRKLNDHTIQGTAEKDLVRELEKYDEIEITFQNSPLQPALQALVDALPV